MTPATDQGAPETRVELNLVDEIKRILQESPEPVTVSRLRDLLPKQLRHTPLNELSDQLGRLATAQLAYQFPKYRSPQDRYWDRPMPMHVAALIRSALQERALPWSELRRKLPVYAQPQAEGILKEQIAAGQLYRHPRHGREGERFGVRPADPKDYLRNELAEMFRGLQKMGFGLPELREGALELLHEEEWASVVNSPEPKPSRSKREPRTESVDAMSAPAGDNAPLEEPERSTSDKLQPPAPASPDAPGF